MWAHDIIFILILCTGCIVFVGAEKLCGQQYEVPKWEPDESTPYRVTGLGNTTNNDGKTVLRVEVENVTENMNLSVFLRPSETDNCPPAPSEYKDLRRFNGHASINMNNGTMIAIETEVVFTGCYYFQMENAEGKKWIMKPYFYKGNSCFLDTALKCTALDYSGPSGSESHELTVALQVPLICPVLKCELFEFDKTDRNTIDNLNAGKIPAKQTCRVTWRGIHKTLQVDCGRADTKLNVTALPGNESLEQWETTIQWLNLKMCNAEYYSKYEIDYHHCSGSNAKLLEWLPVVVFGAVTHDPNSSNVLSPVTPSFFQSKDFRVILFTIAGFTVLAVLVYWATRCVRIMLDKKRRSNNLFVKPQETAQLYHLNESDEILLIYARDSPEFMETVDALRQRLRKICHFKVRDVYATNEWSLIAELGATRWVEDRLRAGSKVVWVDTPQFRSVVTNNNSERRAQNQYDAIDFRDEAIPYAVTLATHLFQNAKTQYRQHFVVRMEGFEVGDGSDDPLLAVSPHARYFVPEHLDLLDKHLAR